jgi:hypothetical protein
MPFAFCPIPLDVVECGRRFTKKVAAEQFGDKVVLLADAVIARHQTEDELMGIRRCLTYVLETLEWNEGSRLFPSRCKLTAASPGSPHRHLLADSVIATTLLYRGALDESVSGLRRVAMSEFIQGLEWACSAFERIGPNVMLREAPHASADQASLLVR